ncbi:hypothetical protein C8F04DRAFT_226665 [Mycena alexandri]|uniref:Uncharacterized protein n=1 Tax=Mycena alexandri TaxID=1745969 RepID=A0AAD6X8N0_9AGAR|nr:hypothetical protein C8F04DRAFT_226665 [Mycena alexandri]
MPRLYTVALFALLFAPSALAGSSCVAFDTAWNLLAFNFKGKDYNAGTSDSWASGTPTDITTTGRPPFDGTNTKCYLAQFFNAIYVLGADSSKPNDIYIYDAAGKKWTDQSITAAGFDPTSFEAILDHDTNVFYALSKGETYSLDMGDLAAAQSSAIPWKDQGAAEITTTNYDPVMAVAQNHVFFFGVPGNAAGSASIFVIHFAFWQTPAQAFSGTAFPDSHGQATSFFLDSGVQQEIAFIPDDGSKTYIVNIETNSTITMAGPSVIDAAATYFASTTALVQLAANGAVSWIPYDPSSNGANAANTAAKWSPVASLNTITGSSASSGSSSGSSGASGSAGASGGSASKTSAGAAGGSAATGGAKSGSPSGTGSGAAPSGSGASAAVGRGASVAWGAGSVLGLVGIAFSLL